MIFDLLDQDQFTLADTWSRYFPERELKRLATVWGTPLH